MTKYVFDFKSCHPRLLKCPTFQSALVNRNHQVFYSIFGSFWFSVTYLLDQGKLSYKRYHKEMIVVVVVAVLNLVFILVCYASFFNVDLQISTAICWLKSTITMITNFNGFDQNVTTSNPKRTLQTFCWAKNFFHKSTNFMLSRDISALQCNWNNVSELCLESIKT